MIPDTTWEINIEDDPEMMQAPKKISVSMTLNIVTNELPQKGGKFYTLAKTFEDDDQAKDGNDNWLSDMKKNPVRPPEVINNTNPDDSIFGQLNPGDTEVPEGFKSDTISLFTDSVS
jgi:hypothetical protein